jgi:hypothetical protein
LPIHTFRPVPIRNKFQNVINLAAQHLADALNALKGNIIVPFQSRYNIGAESSLLLKLGICHAFFNHRMKKLFIANGHRTPPVTNLIIISRNDEIFHENMNAPKSTVFFNKIVSADILAGAIAETTRYGTFYSK